MNMISLNVGKKKPKKKMRSAGPGDVVLGKKIRLRRIERNLSQEGLAVRLGVTFQQVQKYEKGKNRVSVTRLQQIAVALNTPTDFFYEGDGKSTEMESLLFEDGKFSLRLLRAYTKIADKTVARRFVSLLETIAKIEPEDSDL
jgi:transcriptional regulator with XRE-family HTH domain